MNTLTKLLVVAVTVSMFVLGISMLLLIGSFFYPAILGIAEGTFFVSGLGFFGFGLMLLSCLIFEFMGS